MSERRKFKIWDCTKNELFKCGEGGDGRNEWFWCILPHQRDW